MKRIHVAVGVVYNQQGLVLVGQRVVQDLYFEKWEFPGGKLEEGEPVEAALAREFKEEIGIDIRSTEFLLTLDHNYPDRHVRLHVWIVTEFDGEVSGLEGQALRWVEVDDLDNLDFLQGNQAIVDALKQRAQA